MITFDFTVRDALGLHARPAGLLVSEAQKYESELSVTLHRTGKQASLKKLLAVMGLGVKGEDSITVTVEGEDERIAAEAIEQWLKAHLG